MTSPTDSPSAHRQTPGGRVCDAAAPQSNATEYALAHEAHLVQLVSDAIISVDNKGDIVSWNHAAAELYGYSADEAIGQRFYSLTGVAASVQLERKLLTAFAAGQSLKERCWQRRRDGRKVVVEATLSAIRDEAGQLCGMVGVHRDVTREETTEQALLESERRYRQLYEHSLDGIVSTDLQGRILDCNRAFEHMLGYSVEELRALHFQDLTPARWHSLESAIVRERILVDGWSGLYEKEYRRKDGTVFPIELSSYLICDEHYVAIGMWGIVRDISERKRFEHRLRTLASQLSLAEERERRRIAGVLHDQVGQTLALLNIKLAHLKTQFSAPELRQECDALAALCREAIHGTRDLTYDLSPPVLYELGLGPALSWLVEQHKVDGIEFSFEDDNQDKPLAEDSTVQLYIAARELLHNCVKHAHAKHVRVSLVRDESHVCLQVVDDGIGMELTPLCARVDAGGGFGLFSIRERLVALNAQLELASQLNRGTSATVRVPLPQSTRT